jgi:hypothetical protein
MVIYLHSNPVLRLSKLQPVVATAKVVGSGSQWVHRVNVPSRWLSSATMRVLLPPSSGGRRGPRGGQNTWLPSSILSDTSLGGGTSCPVQFVPPGAQRVNFMTKPLAGACFELPLG